MPKGKAPEETTDYASPACFMHEVDPAYLGLPPHAADNVFEWRRAERERLIAARLGIPPEQRKIAAERITFRLDKFLGDVRGKRIGVYWPFRGEPDLRQWMESVWERGGSALLPIVIEKAAPLIFKPWRQGEELGRGVWNIPIPIDGEAATPDIVIAPVVGYDRSCFRLGYGGGYFDRTLAIMKPKPLAIGIGYDVQAIDTIHPQSFDVAMNVIITDTGIHHPS
ncbi:MAG: 5-formyltetrahydrofolate cyclo-ligase [Shinella sp.]|nr:5-formyltetrahydrofolate cyclo-ligase [Shinella sp.]